MKKILSRLVKILELDHLEEDEDYVYDSLWHEDNSQKVEHQSDWNNQEKVNIPENSSYPKAMNSSYPDQSWSIPDTFQSHLRKSSPLDSKSRTIDSSEIVIKEFQCFADVVAAVQQIREQKLLVLNFGKIDIKEAQRALDFMAGSICIANGSVEYISESIFLFTPHFIKINSSAPQDNNLAQEALINPDKMPASEIWRQAS